MAKYVLGDEGARKFRKLTQLNLDFNSTPVYGKQHALDNAYPHPYEVRWSNSLLSTDGEPGGYMMWLPGQCFYMNLSAVKTSDFPQIDEGEIEPIEEGSLWYKLTPNALGASGAWPDEFDVWMNVYLSGDNELSGGPIFSTLSVNPEDFAEDGEATASSIHITHVKDYRPRASVRSSIVLGGGGSVGEADERSVGLSGDVLSSSLSQLSSEYHIWHFHDDENDLSVATLVEGDSGTEWLADGLDLVLRDKRGQQTRDGYVNEVVYLPFQDLLDKFQQDWGNGAPGGDNPTNSINVDEQSVSKEPYEEQSEGDEDEPVHILHIKNFHNSSANVSACYDSDFLLRTPAGGESLSGHVEYIHFNDLSAILGTAVDEESISKGGDGWTETDAQGRTISSLHLWHFHDNLADAESPEMCDFVLRYNSYPATEDKWLRYCSLEDVEAKISTDIRDPLTDYVKDQLSGLEQQISADIQNPITNYVIEQLSGSLSAEDCGMFKWTPETRTIGPGGCMVGRQWVTATGTGVSGRGDYLWSLCVTISNTGSVSAKVVSDATLGKPPTQTQCWIPIYQIINGKIGVDYRGAFVVPAYE